MIKSELIEKLHGLPDDSLVVSDSDEYGLLPIDGEVRIVSLIVVSCGQWKDTPSHEFHYEGTMDQATESYGGYKGGVTFKEINCILIK